MVFQQKPVERPGHLHHGPSRGRPDVFASLVCGLATTCVEKLSCACTQRNDSCVMCASGLPHLYHDIAHHSLLNVQMLRLRFLHTKRLFSWLTGLNIQEKKTLFSRKVQHFLQLSSPTPRFVGLAQLDGNFNFLQPEALLKQVSLISPHS